MANQANVSLLTQDPQLVPQTVTTLAGGGPTSQRPTNPSQWFHYYDTDLNREAVWNGAVWIISNSGPTGPQGPQGPQGPAALFGPTAMRPSNPAPFQRYFDTDINTEIWWERGAWRTVAGTVGDFKVVQAASAAAAVAANPGWVIDNSAVPATLTTTLFQPEQMPQLVYTGGNNGQWFSYDLSAHMASVGLTGAAFVHLTMEAYLGPPGFRNQGSFNVFISVASTAQGSGAITAMRARADGTIDDSNTSASDNTAAMVKLVDGNNFFYSLNWYRTPSPAGSIWLAGFTYNPLVHPTTITSFGVRKT